MHPGYHPAANTYLSHTLASLVAGYYLFVQTPEPYHHPVMFSGGNEDSLPACCIAKLRKGVWNMTRMLTEVTRGRLECGRLLPETALA